MVVADDTVPLPLVTKRASEKEALFTGGIGSACGIRTRDLLLEREVS